MNNELKINEEFNFETLEQTLEALKYYSKTRKNINNLDWFVGIYTDEKGQIEYSLEVELDDIYSDVMFYKYVEGYDDDEYSWL